MRHSLTPHDKESPSKAVQTSAGAESALGTIFSFSLPTAQGKIPANASSFQGISLKYNKR